MRPITYERIYYSDVETLQTPPAALQQAAEQAAQMMHPDRTAVWYATEHNPRFLERQIRGNPAYRVTIGAQVQP